MQNCLDVLERLRSQLRRDARLAFAESERQRSALAGRLRETEELLHQARHDGVADAAFSLNAQHTWRLNLELARRSGERALQRQETQVDERREHLAGTSREARLAEILVERRDARRMEHARRTEYHEMDSAAASQWYTRCAN